MKTVRAKINTVIIVNYHRIRNLREDKDLTQAFVGTAINVPQRTYAYYESGERTIPPHVLTALAEFHATSIDYILNLTDNPNPYERKNKTRTKK